MNLGEVHSEEPIGALLNSHMTVEQPKGGLHTMFTVVNLCKQLWFTVGFHMFTKRLWRITRALMLKPWKSRDWWVLMYSIDSHLVAHGRVSEALLSK